VETVRVAVAVLPPVKVTFSGVRLAAKPAEQEIERLTTSAKPFRLFTLTDEVVEAGP